MILSSNTKIIATAGPATDSIEELREVISAGANILRLNFSHGQHSYFKKIIDDIRLLEAQMNISIPVIQDLQGPKIRLGEMPEPVFLKKGQKVTFTVDKSLSDAKNVFLIDYPGVADVLKKGGKILIDDGNVEMEVESVSAPYITAINLNDSVISSRKGVNLPGSYVDIPALTEKDMLDLKFGLENGVDYVALSFVKSHKDMELLRKIIDPINPDTGIIAKIERPEAMEDIEKIAEVSDALLVARGDLGIEVSLEHVPAIQHKLLKVGREYKKPVIVATQMLESMKSNPTPTRAEVTDVYEAVIDGADVVMLSAETSVGKFPAKAVGMMRKIIEVAEKEIKPHRFLWEEESTHDRVEDTIALTAGRLTEEIGASFTCVFTASGRSARMVSKNAPKRPILAFTFSEPVMRKISLYKGVLALKMEKVNTIDELFDQGVKKMLELNLVSRGQNIVFVTGQPLGRAGTTNMLKVHSV